MTTPAACSRSSDRRTVRVVTSELACDLTLRRPHVAAVATLAERRAARGRPSGQSTTHRPTSDARRALARQSVAGACARSREGGVSVSVHVRVPSSVCRVIRALGGSRGALGQGGQGPASCRGERGRLDAATAKSADRGCSVVTPDRLRAAVTHAAAGATARQRLTGHHTRVTATRRTVGGVDSLCPDPQGNGRAAAHTPREESAQGCGAVIGPRAARPSA